MLAECRLVRPCPRLFRGFESAVAHGWSPTHSWDSSARVLEDIRAGRAAWLASQLAMDSSVKGLKIERHWIESDGFAGVLDLRWSPRRRLPSNVNGHVGYAVVPWRRGVGCATRALELAVARAGRVAGLDVVEVTCDFDNEASRRAIEKCGGVPVGFKNGTLRFEIAVGDLDGR